VTDEECDDGWQAIGFSVARICAELLFAFSIGRVFAQLGHGGGGESNATRTPTLSRFTFLIGAWLTRSSLPVRSPYLQHRSKVSLVEPSTQHHCCSYYYMRHETKW